MSYFGNIHNFFPRTFQELSSTKFMFFHSLFVGTDYNTFNKIKIMLEVFNSMQFVICHKVTNYYSRIPLECCIDLIIYKDYLHNPCDF